MAAMRVTRLAPTPHQLACGCPFARRPYAHMGNWSCIPVPLTRQHPRLLGLVQMAKLVLKALSSTATQA